MKQMDQEITNKPARPDSDAQVYQSSIKQSIQGKKTITDLTRYRTTDIHETVSSNSDQVSRYTDFVYMKCRNETRLPQSLVSSLLQELVEKSTVSKFYQTSTGDDTFAVSGKFQCRHDLTINDCHDCIVKTGMYAMGQCVGSLEECECGACVSNAFQVAQDECWGSDSGEVYLQNCFISYSDYKPQEAGGNSYQGKGVGGGSAKIAALVVGAGVALGLLSTLCYCIKSSARKQT
ncbi:hypothetical protein E3N88_21593 [Mikania micrantha]|uniref:Gnk2-homologous domain-containing protein n=1 Tax=Mikania micrantha TaxID=192012 RepID=A0A5N6N7Z0_9ASTR|nr:hypothetical protein E3N88_21593 [Mikania micrantha]